MWCFISYNCNVVKADPPSIPPSLRPSIHPATSSSAAPRSPSPSSSLVIHTVVRLQMASALSLRLVTLITQTHTLTHMRFFQRGAARRGAAS